LFHWFLGKFSGAVGQQVAIQWFLWPVCYGVVRHRGGALGLAALLFGALHLPSPLLVGLTLIATVAWIGLYQRSQRLAPLIVSHVLLFTIAYGALPLRLTDHMKVGAEALEQHKTLAVLDEPEVRAWLNALARIDQSQLDTQAEAEAFTRWLFLEIVNRPPTTSELEQWSQALEEYSTVQLATILLTSDTYRGTHGSTPLQFDPPNLSPPETATRLAHSPRTQRSAPK